MPQTERTLCVLYAPISFTYIIQYTHLWVDEILASGDKQLIKCLPLHRRVLSECLWKKNFTGSTNCTCFQMYKQNDSFVHDKSIYTIHTVL